MNNHYASAHILLIYICLCFLASMGSCRSLESKKGENLLTTGMDSISTPTDSSIILDDELWIVFQDSQDRFWFGSKNNGVYSFTPENKQNLQEGGHIGHFSTKNGLVDDQLLGIQEDHLGNIFFETMKGVSKYDGHQIQTIPIDTGILIPNEWKLEPTDLWFRIGWDKNGPYRYDGNRLYFLSFPKFYLEDVFNQKFPNAPFNPYGLYSVYKDKDGFIWFGTSSLGTCRFDGKEITWLNDESLAELDNGPASGVRKILEDSQGYFWFNNNLNQKYKLQESAQDNSVLDYDKLSGINTSVEERLNPYCLSMTEDLVGNIWIVTYDSGIWKYNAEELTHYPMLHEKKPILLFSSFLDKNGTLWIGTHEQGVYYFEGDSFKRLNIVDY